MNQAKDVGSESGHRPENIGAGALLTIAAFFCIALVGALAKISGQYTSTGVLLLLQNLICFVFIAPVALRGGWSALRTEKVGLHILRAATGTAAWYALFYAITQIPLANATLLTYSAPLWMPVVAWVVTRQPVARVDLGRRRHRIRRGDSGVATPGRTPSVAASWPHSRGRCPWPSR